MRDFALGGRDLGVARVGAGGDGGRGELDAVGDEDGAGGIGAVEEGDGGGVQVVAVGDEGVVGGLGLEAAVLRGRWEGDQAGETGLAGVQRCHGVEGVRQAGGAGTEGGETVGVGGGRVAEGDAG